MVTKTLQARRVLKARRIIQRAYRLKPDQTDPKPVRFELIGENVALVVLATKCPQSQNTATNILVAKTTQSGRTRKLPDDSRQELTNFRDVVAHLESLHKKYDAPV